MSIDPCINGLFELLDQWERVDTEPADIDLLFHLTDLLLDNSQELDLLIEDIKGWESSDDFLEDDGRHAVEAVHLFLNALVVLITASSSCIHLIGYHDARPC